jgi:hypothetical protein
MLVAAPATTSEILACRLNAMRGRLDDVVGLRARETRFLLGERGLYFFCGQDEGNEHSFAAPLGVSGQPAKAVTAVDQLFDCEEQDMILR